MSDLRRSVFRFECKAADEASGSFTGLASVYGVTDLQGDVVMAGAFTKTIEERGGEVPILWQHEWNKPVGKGTLSDGANGLTLSGDLLLDVQQAREAYALVKAGIVKGLSIGYDVIKDRMEDGVRKLLEIRLWEVSLVTFPANPFAQISSVKEAAAIEAIARELKEGRVLSARNLRQIEDVIASLSALLEAAKPKPAEDEASSSDTPDTPKGTEPSEMAVEPEVLHSARALVDDIKAAAVAAGRRS